MARSKEIRAVALYQKGHSFREIGERLGVSASTARRWVKKPGISIPADPTRRYNNPDTILIGSTPPELSAPCMRPPQGWRCTRGKDHGGPCAAVPFGSAHEDQVDNVRSVDGRPRFDDGTSLAWWEWGILVVIVVLLIGCGLAVLNFTPPHHL